MPPRAIYTAVLGTAVYGAGTFVWQVPVLLDETIRASEGLTEEEIIASDSLIFMGWAIGAVVCGRLTDIFGRKPIAIASVLLIVVHLLVAAASPGILGLDASRLIGGFGIGGTAAGFMLAIEHANERERSATAKALNIYNHAAGYMMLAAIHGTCGAFALSWRFELVSYAVALAAFTFVVAAVVPESPEFLAQAKPQYRSWLARSITPPSSPKPGSDGGEGSIAQLLQWRYSASTARLTLCFIAGIVMYYTLSFRAGSISDSLVVNIMLLSLLDIPGYVLADLLLKRQEASGRDLPRTVSRHMALCAALHLAVGVASALGIPLVAVLTTVGKMAVAGVMQLNYLMPAKLFPPRLRSTALGVASGCARIVCMAVPAVARELSLFTSSMISVALALAASLAIRSAPAISVLPVREIDHTL